MDLLFILVVACGVIALVQIALQIVLMMRVPRVDLSPIMARVDLLEKQFERSERLTREDLQQAREESSSQAKDARTEISAILQRFHQMTAQAVSTLGQGQGTQIQLLTESNERKLEELRVIVDQRLKELQADNAQQIDKMRATVDEKLQGTLERRLGESFRLVSERLELVHKGLGEMQALAVGVGDLKRVLTNVKTRGGWGEVQLGALLADLLAPHQYSQNVRTNPQSNENVEYAICLPGRSGDGEQSVWLPIDSKFPSEEYQRFVEAHEAADAVAAEEAARMIDQQMKLCAREISSKYLSPPHTTDFAIMFLPTEGLYAEVARRQGLIDQIQRDYRVVVSGPATFAAFLNSLQMGFRTIAIEKRSAEVWTLLGAVKSEFGKFGDVIDAVKRKIDQASSTMEDVAVRSRAIQRKLRQVEEVPQENAVKLLADDEAA